MTPSGQGVILGLPTCRSVAATAGLVRRTLPAVAIVWMVVGLAACGGGARSEPATTIGPTVGTVDASPEPAFAWALDGDGAASVGGVDLAFSGSHNLGAEWASSIAIRSGSRS